MISHCAINQLTYWLLQKQTRAQVAFGIQLADWESRIREYYSFCQAVTECLSSPTSNLKERYHKFLLAGDEVGIEAVVHLLVQLCSAAGS